MKVLVRAVKVSRTAVWIRVRYFLRDEIPIVCIRSWRVSDSEIVYGSGRDFLKQDGPNRVGCGCEMINGKPLRT